MSSRTNHAFGSVTVYGATNLNNNRLSGVSEPVNASDVATKNYVDSSIVSSDLQGGVGITIDPSNFININESQTTIKYLGTIQSGIWNGSSIPIAYGGTGQTTFSTNKLIYSNGSNSLVSTNELTFDSTNLQSSVPIFITNTNDTSNNTDGALVVLGGITVAKRLFVNGNAQFLNDVTVGNIKVNGSLTLNTINANNAIFTNVSTSSLNASVINLISFLVTPLTSTSNLIVTNTSCANLTSLSNTFANAIFTNLTSSSLNVPGVSILNTANITNISTGLLNCSNSSITHLLATNISTGTLRASTLVSTSNLTATNTTISNVYIPTLLYATAANLVSTICTNGNITNITSSNFSSTNTTISNILSTNISASNLNIVNTVNTSVISSGNVYVSSTLNALNITNTNLNATNLTLSNSIITISTIGALRVSGNTQLSNTVVTNCTATSLFINNFLTSTFNSFVGTTTGTLNVTGQSVFSNTQSTSTSTGTLYSNISTTNNCSIGTLNVSGNINNSTGTIITTTISASNLYTSNIVNTLNNICTNNTSTNLYSTNGTISNSLNTNTSTGTLQVSSIINTLNLNSTNITSTNMLNTNTSTSNIRITTASIGNSFIVNNSVANTSITNEVVLNSTIANIMVNTNANFNKTLVINSNYQGGIISSAGSFLNVLPSTYTNNVSPNSGSVNAWYANYIGSPSLVATNLSITTQKASNLYLQSNVTLGANQNVINNAALAIGYINNSVGSSISGQIMLERSDGNWFTSIYVENNTNRMIIANANFSGGGGIGINTVSGTPVIYNSIVSSTNTTQTPYIQLTNTSSNFYSTVDSNSTTTGSLFLAGGLGVDKTIVTNSLALGYQLITPINGENVILSANYTGLVIKLASGLATLTLTLPTSNIPDGKIIFITTNQTITTVTLVNTVLSSTSLSSASGLRLIYVLIDNLWYTI
jgi:hypothetical protein